MAETATVNISDSAAAIVANYPSVLKKYFNISLSDEGDDKKNKNQAADEMKKQTVGLRGRPRDNVDNIPFGGIDPDEYIKTAKNGKKQVEKAQKDFLEAKSNGLLDANVKDEAFAESQAAYQEMCNEACQQSLNNQVYEAYAELASAATEAYDLNWRETKIVGSDKDRTNLNEATTTFFEKSANAITMACPDYTPDNYQTFIKSLPQPENGSAFDAMPKERQDEWRKENYTPEQYEQYQAMQEANNLYYDVQSLAGADAGFDEYFSNEYDKSSLDAAIKDFNDENKLDAAYDMNGIDWKAIEEQKKEEQKKEEQSTISFEEQKTPSGETPKADPYKEWKLNNPCPSGWPSSAYEADCADKVNSAKAAELIAAGGAGFAVSSDLKKELEAQGYDVDAVVKSIEYKQHEAEKQAGAEANAAETTSEDAKPDPYAAYKAEHPIEEGADPAEYEQSVRDAVNQQAAKAIWNEGKFGNGQERIKNLEDAGYNPTEVQAEVNKMIGEYEASMAKVEPVSNEPAPAAEELAPAEITEPASTETETETEAPPRTALDNGDDFGAGSDADRMIVKNGVEPNEGWEDNDPGEEPSEGREDNDPGEEPSEGREDNNAEETKSEPAAAEENIQAATDEQNKNMTTVGTAVGNGKAQEDANKYDDSAGAEKDKSDREFD